MIDNFDGYRLYSYCYDFWSGHGWRDSYAYNITNIPIDDVTVDNDIIVVHPDNIIYMHEHVDIDVISCANMDIDDIVRICNTRPADHDYKFVWVLRRVDDRRNINECVSVAMLWRNDIPAVADIPHNSNQSDCPPFRGRGLKPLSCFFASEDRPDSQPPALSAVAGWVAQVPTRIA